MKKWVVLSCTPNSIYDFFLPIAVRIWKNRIGYQPAVILLGSEVEWCSGHAGVVYREILGKERIEFFGGIPDLPEATVSQSVRQHVAALEFDPDDLLLIGDVDLFPVDRDFYHRYDPSSGPVGVYYAEMYEDVYWPAYGVSMPVRNWREVMGITVGDLKGSLERTLLEGDVRTLVAAHDANPNDTRYWFFDERNTTRKIRESRFAGEVLRFSMSVNGKEPWRVKLPPKPVASSYVDFHCSRPGWNGENWPDIRHMLAQMIPDDLQWLDRYLKVYRNSL
jgi:hypothetical protein